MTYRRPKPLGQLSFFDPPAEALPPALFGPHVRLILAETLATARDVRGLDRNAVALEMTQRMGASVTKRQLDRYCAPSQAEWKFPLEALPALHAVTGDDRLLTLAARCCGQRVVPSEAGVHAEMALLEMERRELLTKARAVGERQRALAQRISHGERVWLRHQVGRRGA